MFSQVISTRSLMKMLNRAASNLLSISVLCCWSPPSGLGSPASFQPMTPSTSSACLWGSYRGWSQRSYRSPGRHYPMSTSLSLIPTVEREMMVFPCCWQWRWPTRCHFFPTLFPAPLSFPSLGHYLGVSVGIHQGFYGEGSSKLLSPVTWRTQSLPRSLSSHCYMAGTGLVSRQATAKVCRYFLQEGQVMGGRQTTDVREDRQFT